MNKVPYYRVERPHTSGMQDYLNRAHEAGWEAVSVSPWGPSESEAILVLRPANTSDLAANNKVLRQALAVYCSALRSGEIESRSMRELSDRAFGSTVHPDSDLSKGSRSPPLASATNTDDKAKKELIRECCGYCVPKSLCIDADLRSRDA